MIVAVKAAIAFPPATAVIFAQAENAASTSWVTYLLNGGPFAIVLLLIIFDKIGTHEERNRLRVEAKELRDKNQNLNDVLRQEVVPPLTELNRLMAEVLKALDDRDDRSPPNSRRRS